MMNIAIASHLLTKTSHDRACYWWGSRGSWLSQFPPATLGPSWGPVLHYHSQSIPWHLHQHLLALYFHPNTHNPYCSWLYTIHIHLSPDRINSQWPWLARGYSPGRPTKNTGKWRTKPQRKTKAYYKMWIIPLCSLYLMFDLTLDSKWAV